MKTTNILDKKYMIPENYNWKEIRQSVLYHLSNVIRKQSSTFTNSYIDIDDAVVECQVKTLETLEHLRGKDYIVNKTIQDLVNYNICCLNNHLSTLKHKFSLSVDTSVNTARIIEEFTDLEEENENYQYIAKSDDEDDLLIEDINCKVLVDLLANGFVREYIVYKNLVYQTNVEVESNKRDIKHVAKALGFNNKETAEILKNISITLIKLGFINDKLVKAIGDNLLYYGITNG